MYLTMQANKEIISRIFGQENVRQARLREVRPAEGIRIRRLSGLKGTGHMGAYLLPAIVVLVETIAMKARMVRKRSRRTLLDRLSLRNRSPTVA